MTRKCRLSPLCTDWIPWIFFTTQKITQFSLLVFSFLLRCSFSSSTSRIIWTKTCCKIELNFEALSRSLNIRFAAARELKIRLNFFRFIFVTDKRWEIYKMFSSLFFLLLRPCWRCHCRQHSTRNFFLSFSPLFSSSFRCLSNDNFIFLRGREEQDGYDSENMKWFRHCRLSQRSGAHKSSTLKRIELSRSLREWPRPGRDQPEGENNNNFFNNSILLLRLLSSFELHIFPFYSKNKERKQKFWSRRPDKSSSNRDYGQIGFAWGF